MIEFQGVAFSKHGPVATEADIESFEQTIGHRLPDEYCAFLLAVGGGELHDNLGVPIEDKYVRGEIGEEHVPVRKMYNVAPGSHLHILFHAEDYNYHLRSPSYVFPIGWNGIEHRISMSLGDHDYGKIYVWVPSPGELWIEDEDCRQDYTELYEIANDFEHFWKSLRPVPPMN